MGLARDGSSNSVGDLVSNVGSAMHIISPGLPRGDTDLLMKVSCSLFTWRGFKISVFKFSKYILKALWLSDVNL